MIIEDTRESILEAKRLLGIPANSPVGFIGRVNAAGVMKYQPVLDWKGVRYQVGDEIPDLVSGSDGGELPE